MRFVVTGNIGESRVEMASATVDYSSVEELGIALKQGEITDDLWGVPIPEDQLVSIVLLDW